MSEGQNQIRWSITIHSNLERTHVDDVDLVVKDRLECQALLRPELRPFDGLFLLRRRVRLSGGLCGFYRFWHVSIGDGVE
jgi:hypothetical protein